MPCRPTGSCSNPKGPARRVRAHTGPGGGRHAAGSGRKSEAGARLSPEGLCWEPRTREVPARPGTKDAAESAQGGQGVGAAGMGRAGETGGWEEERGQAVVKEK